MDLEEKLKTLIIDNYGNLKNFAKIIDLPYSTVDTIFKRGLMKSGIANIISICNELNISVDGLSSGVIEPISDEREDKGLVL